MKALTTLLVLGMFLMPAALADDADDVKAAVQGYFDAINSGNAAAMVRHRMPEYSVFAGGELISRSHSLEEQRNNFQASVDAGQKRNLQVRHIEVKIYGNAAVVTSYLTGTNTAPDGTVNQPRQQRTGVWIKQGGQWKEAHRHASPLQFSQEQSALEGTWKTQEITLVQGPNAGTIADPQPSLFIFTKKHYNIMYVRGTEPRPLLEEESTRTSLTEAELRATFEPFVANSGTYELSGSTLTTHPQVALWPNFMSGGTAVYDYRVEGNSLWLTYSNGARLKLARVE
jgi:ketosteroid isomerase-like protein